MTEGSQKQQQQQHQQRSTSKRSSNSSGNSNSLHRHCNPSDLAANCLAPGDHIYVSSASGGSRHGIYVGYQGYTHWIVHVKNQRVVQSGLEQFVGGRPLKRARYAVSVMESSLKRILPEVLTCREDVDGSICYTDDANDVQTVVGRALAAVDEQEDSYWHPDGEHFARYCRTGKIDAIAASHPLHTHQAHANSHHTITQIDKVKRAVVGAMVGALLGLMTFGPWSGVLLGCVLGLVGSLFVIV